MSEARNIPATLTGLMARARGVLSGAPAQETPPESAAQTAPEARLILPARDTTEEETSRATHQSRGQFLARQERWDELSTALRRADEARAKTTGGMAVAELLAYGARADVVQACEDALIDDAEPSSAGLEALESVLDAHRDDYPVALVLAQAYIDCGWAWRGSAWRDEVPERRRAQFERHFARAAEILDTRCSDAFDAPSVAAARCALLAAEPRPRERVADDYEDLIDLDPENPRPMRAMGNHLLPRWFGSYEMLELEARRTASRTMDVWGAGAYSWVYFDALSVDPQAAERMDVEFFVEGLDDILSRKPNQHFANVIAAYCALTMAPDAATPLQSEAARSATSRIHGCFDWVLMQHLREVHPLIWAEAAAGPGLVAPLPAREALWRKGASCARKAIAGHFADELTRGTTVTFSPHGVRLYPAM